MQLQQVNSSRLQMVQEAVATSLLNREQTIPTEFFSGDPDLSTERLRIYRGNLYAVWATALQNTFPVIQQLVGEDFFKQLAILYGQQYPSESGDLSIFGQYFAQFLASEASVLDYPYFSAVAEIEWKLHRAYYSADAEVLDFNTFLSTAGEHVANYVFTCHPSVALLVADVAAVQICLAHQHDELGALDFSLNAPSFALVNRCQWQVQLTQLSHAELLSLQALCEGESLGVALERAIDCDQAFDVAQALRRWFALGIFIECRCKN